MKEILEAVTPFCSCSSIPIFIGFLEAKAPLGIAFSFIITSPLVNEVVFVLMGGVFGWKIAFLYALSGIILGVIAGLIIGRLKLNKEIILKLGSNKGEKLHLDYLPKSLEGKIQFALQEGFSIFKKLWWIIVIGVGIGAVIQGYVLHRASALWRSPAPLFKKKSGAWSLSPPRGNPGPPLPTYQNFNNCNY